MPSSICGFLETDLLMCSTRGSQPIVLPMPGLMSALVVRYDRAAGEVTSTCENERNIIFIYLESQYRVHRNV